MTLRRRAAIALATTSLAAFGLAACATADESEDTTDETTTTETSTSDDTTSDETASDSGSSAYADGTYTAEGSYTSPGGEETITVTVTLADGVIEDVEVTNDETTNANSLRYQGEFIDGIAAEVVGVALDDVSVDRVGGSSLTSAGFEDALETIRDEAAA